MGWPLTDREQALDGGGLACGEGAVLSHRERSRALGDRPRGRRDRVDVSYPPQERSPRPGIRARFDSRLSRRETSREPHGIPVTTPVRTLIDLATELTPNRLERAVNEADKRDLIDPEALRERARRPRRRAGRASRSATLLDRHTFRLSDTELEVLFRPIAAQAGLPVPLTKEMVNGFEVDFYWPDLGLVVETDGWRYHRTASAQTRDALRDQTHTASGLTPLRFSHYQVSYEPDARPPTSSPETAGQPQALGGCASPSPCVPAVCVPVAWSTLWTTSAGLATPTKTKL